MNRQFIREKKKGKCKYKQGVQRLHKRNPWFLKANLLVLVWNYYILRFRND